jgi:hypothetical protein
MRFFKQKTIAKIFILLAFFWPLLSNAQLWQLNYPELPGIRAPERGNLPDFLRYVYQIFLGGGTLLAVLFLFWGGLLYLISSGNPNQQNQAQKMISSALLGLLILFTSYTVLSTLDPNLVIWGIQIGDLRLPQINAPTNFRAKESIGCQELPLQKTFESMHQLQKESFFIVENINRVIPKANTNDLGEIGRFAQKIKDEIEECTCSQFTSYCYRDEGVADSGTARCPSVCPAQAGDPCENVPDLRQKDIPGLLNALTKFDDLVKLLEDWGAFRGLSEEEKAEILKKIKNKMETGFEENPVFFADFVEQFAQYLDSLFDEDLFPTDNETQTRERRIQLDNLLRDSLLVQLGILENIVRKLTEIRMELEKYRQEAAQCRAETRQGTKNLFTCSEAKARGILKDCLELDLYCCP